MMLSYFRLAVWTVFWLVAWPVTLPFKKPGQHNCLTWALRQIDKNDGYLVIRWCRSSAISWLRWPHFLYLEAKHHEHLHHFVPKTDEHTKKLIPDPWFTGYIKDGDPKDDKDEN